MEKLFPLDSPVARVFEALQQHAIAQGESVEAFEKKLDVGYREDPHYVPVFIQERGKISAGEVLEYAYRFKEFYPILHKHGFPVPFAIDDFDPATMEDQKDEQQIQQAIQQAKADLRQDPALREGTDDYRLALAKKLFDWFKERIRNFHDERMSQYPAWLALQKNSGECVDASAILFTLYKEAGLDPCFFAVHSLEPTLENYESMEAESFKDGHVFIGFPLAQGKRWIYVDGINREFDPPFSQTIPLSPRQFTTGAYLYNLISIASQQQNMAEKKRLNEICRQVAPLSAYCFEQGLSLYLNEGNGELSRRYVQQNASLFSYYPFLRQGVENILAVVRGLRSGEAIPLSLAFQSQVDFMEQNKQARPFYAATQLFILYQNCMTILEGLSELGDSWRGHPAYAFLVSHAKMALTHALTVNPNFMAPYGGIEELCSVAPHLYPEMFGFLNELAKQNPNHQVAHYLAARIGSQAVKEQSYQWTDDEMAKIKFHVEQLQRLAPDQPGTTLVTLGLLFYQGDFAGTARYFEERERQSRVLPFYIYAQMPLVYLQLGDVEQARRICKKIFNFSPKDGPSALASILDGPMIPKIRLSEEGEQTPQKRGYIEMNEDKVWRRSVDFLQEMIQLVETAPAMKGKTDGLNARFLYVVLSTDQKRHVPALRKALGQELSPVALGILRQDFAGFLEQLSGIQKFSIKNLKGAEQFFTQIKAFFSEEEKPLIAKGFVELARLYLLRGDKVNAKRMFERGLALSESVLTEEVYAARLIREIFTPIVQKAEDHSLLDEGLTVLEWGYSHRTKLNPGVIQVMQVAYGKLVERYNGLASARQTARLVERRLASLSNPK